MARRASAAALLAACLLVACGTHAAHAAFCAPGTGVRSKSLLSFLGGLLTGSGSADSGDADEPCAPCGAWEASAGGQDARCELCTPLVSAPNSARSACDCMPGSYVSAAPAAGSARKECTSCGPTAVSSTTNAAACKQCPAGAVAGKNNKCSCPAGFRATGMDVDGVTGCAQCEAGSVSPGGLATACSACPSSTIPLPSGEACGCPAGMRVNSTEPLTCAACDTVFEYSAEPNRLIMCQQCFPFSYANAGHTGCECVGGYYAANLGSLGPLSCRRCPPGTIKADAGNEDLSACVACPEGLEPSGSGKACVEPLCPPGTQTKADGRCELCAEGFFNHRRNGTCLRCANHTISSPDRLRCDACSTGYLQTSDAGEDLSCMACMTGWSWSNDTMSCSEDDHAAAALGDAAPVDESWKELLLSRAKTPALPAPRQIETVGWEQTDLNKFGGRFTRDEE